MRVDISAEDDARIKAMLSARDKYMDAATLAWAPIRAKLDEIERVFGLDAVVDAACNLEFDQSLKTIYLHWKLKEQDEIRKGNTQ